MLREHRAVPHPALGVLIPAPRSALGVQARDDQKGKQRWRSQNLRRRTWLENEGGVTQETTQSLPDHRWGAA